MKKLVMVFALATISLTLTAQDTALVQPPILPPYSGQEINREQIQMRDVPAAVKEELKAADYAGWNIEAVYKALMTDPEKPESEGFLIYIVEMKRRDEKIAIRFDEDGKRLDDIDE
jgi:hypothetical protein